MSAFFRLPVDVVRAFLKMRFIGSVLYRIRRVASDTRRIGAC